jgi:hypothetical protein
VDTTRIGGCGAKEYFTNQNQPGRALAILPCLWQNTGMFRWILILFSVVLGIALGLVYGWEIAPVQYTDITPDGLRIDYRTDYVLMVAEAYHGEQDLALAARRLAVLGSESPAAIAEGAYNYARQAGYEEADLTAIQELVIALETWQPISGISSP